MAARSLTATPDGIDDINRALTEKKWSREDLAKACDCSRQPAVKFCSGKAVSKKLFVSFCEALVLDWEEIAGLKTAAPTSNSAEPQADIDALVQTIRQQVQADIHHRCGTMRVLDMEQPIGIGDIYTNVNILEKLSGRRRLGLNELLQDCDLENFDRFLLGQIRHERVPGLEAVERHSQLMVLGKPGAGKTTFMKRLATLCNQGEFQAGRVPVFVTLKEFAEAKGQPDLLTYITQQWAACDIEDTEALAQILGLGRVLILLDGLDEVQETDHDRILQEIKDFTGQYRDCQFVMTCRIAAREYIFEHFTEVEVADFDDEQIAEFALKWFKTKGVPEKAKNFTWRLKGNKQIRELANSPLLLTLLCLIFEERDDFLPNRVELYEEGTRLLLKKWDADREIKRDQFYKKLSLPCKEELFSQLAFKTFERGEYFFKQSVAEQYILAYIQSLPRNNKDEEVLQLDSEAFLRSVAAQHGLLVERARGIYSFSHLTFHEYFVARYIASRSSSYELKKFAAYASKRSFWEIFKLVFELLPNSDSLLIAIKEINDASLANDLKLQEFLHYIDRKSKSTPLPYKLSAVRAYYFECERRRLRTDLERAVASFAEFFNGEIVSDNNSESILNEFFSPGELPETLDKKIGDSMFFDFSEDEMQIDAILYDLIDNRVSDSSVKEKIAELSKFDLSFYPQIYDLVVDSLEERDLSTISLTNCIDPFCIKKIRAVIFEYRGIGCDWNSQLIGPQKDQLFQYHDINFLLIQCLREAYFVSQNVRQYIEETLLLPMSEIEKIPVPSH